MGMVPFLARSSFLFSSVFLPVPCDIAQAFQFSTPKRTTSEICILPVSGGVIAKGLTEQARKRLNTMIDANQQSLVHAVYSKIQIPHAVWGDAIESRGIHVAGYDHPWKVTHLRNSGHHRHGHRRAAAVRADAFEMEITTGTMGSSHSLPGGSIGRLQASGGLS